MKTKSRQSSLMAGFWKGLAAPVMLFGSEPTQSANLTPPPRATHRTDRESMRSDWERIGQDFNVALTKARKENAK